MCDSAIAIENRDSCMIGLACKLRHMAEDILHMAIFDGSDVDSVASQYRKYMKDAVNFMAGAHLCERYLYGSIGLHEFCAEMIEEKLESFLTEIPHIPQELLVKYDLAPANMVNDEWKETDDQSNPDEGVDTVDNNVKLEK